MAEQQDIFTWIVDNFYKVFYPEQWLSIDLALSKTEIFLLFGIYRHGEMTMTQIASGMNVSMSTATGIVDRLVQKGYLTRERSESDRRVITVQPTESGRSFIEEVSGLIRKVVDDIYGKLSDEEKSVLLRVIGKVTEYFLSEKEKASNKPEDKQLRKIEIE
jgi:DNA-binding MarR family transcriptional regulator